MPVAACRNRSNFLNSAVRLERSIFKQRKIATVMRRGNRGSLARLERRLLLASAALAIAIGLTGCAMFSKSKAPQATVSPSSDQSADNSAPSGPEAKIQISYSHPNDFLSKLSLTKYSGASELTTEPAGSSGTASVVRFEGGTPMWEIAIKPGMFTKMPIGFSAKTYAIREVNYGVVPPHFVQVIPEAGPPEPLEPDHFYIFSVTRKSGSVSYDAVKANSDGSLQAYDADPRAGTSFRLCCNVSPDFSSSGSAFDTLLPPAGASGP
jgi:hypothetical protein